MRTVGMIGAAIVVSLAAVASAKGGILEHRKLNGKAADVEFLISTPKTCADGSDGSLDRFVSVFGEESLLTSSVAGRTLVNALSVSSVVADSCTGVVTIAAGQVEGGFHSLNPKKAVLNATVPLTDLDTGAPAGSAVVAMTLQGGSIIAFTNEHDKITFPDGSFFRTDQIRSTTRPASASGSITINGVQFINNVFQALMFDNRDTVNDIGR
jgi:hypothetical protein